MQEDVVLPADLLHARPVARRRGDDAAARGDGLQADGADRVRPLAQDHLLDRVGGGDTVILGIRVLAAVFQAVRHLHEALGEGAVIGIALRLAAGGQGAEGGAVVVALAVEDLPLAAAVMARGDLAHHLEDLLVRLGTGVRVVDAAQARHLLDQPLREGRARRAALGAGEIVQLHQLIAHHIGDGFAAIADIDRPDPAGGGVQVLLALGIPHAHAAALDHQLRIDGLVGLVLGEVVPDMGAVGLDQPGDVVGLRNVVHDQPFAGSSGPDMRRTIRCPAIMPPRGALPASAGEHHCHARLPRNPGKPHGIPPGERCDSPWPGGTPGRDARNMLE